MSCEHLKYCESDRLTARLFAVSGELHLAQKRIAQLEAALMIDVTTAGDDGHWDHADIKRLIAYRDRLKAALKEYGGHAIGLCPMAAYIPPKGALCTCGFAEFDNSGDCDDA
jgi:hypothetical protein